ncbi:MAG: hypothetical protein AYK18_07085 [Theionarchaea archaeon DG-70]|nr:MAG: hypothetical protein AYK18_07085 [Theionarchaea archaeon DG-70]
MKETIKKVIIVAVISFYILFIRHEILPLSSALLTILLTVSFFLIFERHINIQAGIILSLYWTAAMFITAMYESIFQGSGISSLSPIRLFQMIMSFIWILFWIIHGIPLEMKEVKVRRPFEQLRFSIGIMAWCKGFGDFFIDSNPDPGIEKIEFHRWSEKNGERDIVGVTFTISLQKKEECP